MSGWVVPPPKEPVKSSEEFKMEIPPPLPEQLKTGGRLIAPVEEHGIQYLVLLEKRMRGIKKKIICGVLYVSLRGRYGVG